MAAPIYWRSTRTGRTPSGNRTSTEETWSRTLVQACSTMAGLKSSRILTPISATLARMVESTSSSSTSSISAASIGSTINASIRSASAPGKLATTTPKRSVSDGSS